MPKFPIKETDVLALADNLVTGFTVHPADFPSITPAEVTALSGKISTFKLAKGRQENSKGDLHVTTTEKDVSLESLVETIKNNLTKAEMDCQNTPENLSEIGWGPRKQPTPIPAPGTPINLKVEAEGTGEIWLNWDKPADVGGTIRNYCVERCEKLPDNNFGPWTFVQSTYSNKAHLLEQPSGKRLIYRIKASNGGGESMPSNTVLVVLP